MTIYNWKEILKSKTDSELVTFFNNELINDNEAKFFAFSELELRNQNYIQLESYRNVLLKNCNNHIKTLRKKSIREYLIIINPYLILSMTFYFLIQFFFNPDFSLNNIWFVGTLFFGTGSIIALIFSKLRINHINALKRKKIETNKLIIEKLTTHNTKL